VAQCSRDWAVRLPVDTASLSLYDGRRSPSCPVATFSYCSGCCGGENEDTRFGDRPPDTWHAPLLPACAGELPRIYIAPGNLVASARASHQFTVFGRDAAGAETPVEGAVTWSLDPGIGTISPSGLFRAGGSADRSGLVRAAVGALSASALVEVVPASPSGGYVFVKSWGGRALDEFAHATGVAVASDGYIYAVDNYNNRVVKRDPQEALSRVGVHKARGWTVQVAICDRDRAFGQCPGRRQRQHTH